MKIVFVLWHPEYTLRLLEPVIDGLAAQGHQLHLGFTNIAAEELDRLAGAWLRGRLAPGFTYSLLPTRADAWTVRAERLRNLRSYLAYLQPRFRDKIKLVERAAEPLPRWLRAIGSIPLVNSRAGLTLLSSWCRRQLAKLPTDPTIDATLRELAPDLLVVSPLLHLPALHHDYLQSARRLSIPTVAAIASWDNLTTKGLCHDLPDRMLVWNEAMKEEAVAIHRVPAERVIVTGAPVYDQWFTRRPRLTHAAFCSEVGLDPRHPYVLYLCSSRFLQDDEQQFIQRWLTGLRAHASPAIRSLGVLIRPYPTSAPWAIEKYAGYGNVTVWPTRGQQNLNDDAKDIYFHSLCHSAAVVGVNTSGLLEAGILRRRCFTICDDSFRHKQQGTVHFEHLIGDGFLIVANSIEQHFAQLQNELHQPSGDDPNVLAFLQRFLRPQGLDLPSAPRAVAAITEMLPGRAVSPRFRQAG